MRFSKRLCCVALSFLSCLIVFYIVSIDSSADVLQDGYFLTPEQFRSIIGESFEVSYYNGSEYVTVNAYYNSYRDNPNYWYAEVDYDRNLLPATIRSGKFLWYTANCSGINGNDPSQFTIRLNPQYSIFDTEQLHTFIAVSSSGNMSASVYQSPSFRWYWDGGLVNFENSLDYNGYRMKIYDGSGRTAGYQFVSADLSSQSLTSGYPVNATFYGVNKIGDVWIALGLPYISNGSSSASGTFATGTTFVGGSGGSDTGDINVNVSVDMDETNSLLDSILDGIGGLVDGVSGLFITDQQYIEEWKISLVNELIMDFAPYADTKDLIDDFAADLFSYGATSSIQFPAISVPNTSFVLPARAVQLKPNGFESMFAALRTVINILATCAVANMIMRKVKAVFVGETVVENEGDDGLC